MDVPFNAINETHRKVVTYKYNPSIGDRDVDKGEHGDHGTHCAGLALASSPSDLSAEGVAPGAKIAFHDITAGETLGAVPDDLSVAYFGWGARAGARVSSNSWGANYDPEYFSHSEYDLQSSQIDQFSTALTDFLVLVAAGNDGANGLGSVGIPAMCKNCFSVGASQGAAIDVLSGFSSRGPARDGRIKPDVVAPGEGVTSVNSDLTDSTCPVRVSSGTSQATPTVAGSAAIVRPSAQKSFRSENYSSCKDLETMCEKMYSK